MHVLRTPDDRFVGLPDYDFEPRYTEVPDPDVGTVRIHHCEAGPNDGQTVLLLHGEPSWSFLYRTMIPGIAAAGHRAIAPDLPGFGRSDKLSERTAYTYERFSDWMWGWVLANDLTDITLFCQDWGGLIGLRLAGLHPERFARIIAANTFLPTGDTKPSEAFLGWRQFSQEAETFPIGALIDGGTVTDLAPEVIAGYDAPFPDDTYKEAARQFPILVPIDTDDPARATNLEAWKGLETFDKPFLTAFSDGDPITAGVDKGLLDRIPGTAGQAHTTIEGGGHFLQEDKGAELARVVVDFMAANP